ncbi:MAG: histidine phosphatase family protein [Bdellovibrionales bacterium]|nr:histidine phosphatase family protein [Bdellovibrionales bacterium]NQZ20390.1 histidine phosphatase family protein [Bdellovibrionales bacterium]
MKLYIIRHAHAEERHIFAQSGKPDELRPLTETGIKRMRKFLQSFTKNEEDINLFLQSPLIRAQQTVDILKEFYPSAEVQTTENLCPGLSSKKLY